MLDGVAIHDGLAVGAKPDAHEPSVGIDPDSAVVCFLYAYKRLGLLRQRVEETEQFVGQLTAGLWIE